MYTIACHAYTDTSMLYILHGGAFLDFSVIFVRKLINFLNLLQTVQLMQMNHITDVLRHRGSVMSLLGT